MGVGYYNCSECKELFADCGDFLKCGNCGDMYCPDCMDTAKITFMDEDDEEVSGCIRCEPKRKAKIEFQNFQKSLNDVEILSKSLTDTKFEVKKDEMLTKFFSKFYTSDKQFIVAFTMDEGLEDIAFICTAKSKLDVAKFMLDKIQEYLKTKHESSIVRKSKLGCKLYNEITSMSVPDGVLFDDDYLLACKPKKFLRNIEYSHVDGDSWSRCSIIECPPVINLD